MGTSCPVSSSGEDAAFTLQLEEFDSPTGYHTLAHWMGPGPAKAGEEVRVLSGVLRAGLLRVILNHHLTSPLATNLLLYSQWSLSVGERRC